MFTQMILNLPVADQEKSKEFFEAIGFSFNKELTDENALCFTITPSTIVALLPNEHFKSAINNQVLVDTSTTNEILLSVGVDSKSAVDTIYAKAIAAGGKSVNPPTDYGTIYGTAFTDIDGHMWNSYYLSSTKL